MSIMKYDYLFFGLQIWIDVHNSHFKKLGERRLFWKRGGNISLQS